MQEPKRGLWLSFQLAAEKVERSLGCSWGKAQKDLLDACANGELKWRNSAEGGPDVLDADLRRWLQQPIAKSRASPKLDLAKRAVEELWPEGAPKGLSRKQIAKLMGDWLTNHCNQNGLPKPYISNDTMLRAAGRKKS